MKQEFEMTQQQMDDIVAINKNQPPVMKFGNYWSGMDLAEKINHYWQTMGDSMGFVWDTVEPSAKGKLFFLATPKAIVAPKTQTEIEIDKYLGDAMGYLNYNVTTSLKKIVSQLEGCNYETEAGYLVNNIAFLALKKLAGIEPNS